MRYSGVRPTEGSGATMSDDDVDEYDSDYGAYEQGIDYHDSGGYGPLVPSESERTLMERMRQELKHELKQASFMSSTNFFYSFSLLSLDELFNQLSSDDYIIKRFINSAEHVVL